MREREIFFKDLCQKKDKEYQDLAYVQTQGIEECQRLRGELKEKELAIAKLKTELEGGEVRQLSLFPGQELTPSQEPTQTPEPVTASPVTEPEPSPTLSPEIVNPESSPEPKTKPKAKTKTKTNPFPEGSLSTKELVAYINQKFPDDGIGDNAINDCLTLKNGKPKSQKLSDYKKKYGFEFLGKFSGQRRFNLV